MLLAGINIFLIILLLWVVYQDFKSRQVHVFLLIALFGVTILINYLTKNLNYIEIVKIAGFIALNIIGLVIYFSIKSRAIINPIDKFLGLGDIIYLVSIAPLFTLNKFIIYFIMGLLFSLIVHVLFKKFFNDKTIPLAGYLSIYLIGLIMANLVLDYNLFIDEY